MATSTPSPLQIIREELPRFLDEPHAADFKDVMSALIPQSPAEAALEVAFAPISRPARMAALATAALTASPDAEGAGGILLRNAPDLKRWLDEAIEFARNRRLYDSGEAERIERIAKELPVVPRAFSPRAVAEKAVFAEPNELVGMTPREFLQTAWPLDVEQVRPYIEHYKDLVREDRFVEPPSGLFTERGLQRMREKGFQGYEDIPFLQYRQMYDDRPLMAQRAVGHEGRHRNVALSELFGPDEPSLVHMIPGVNQPRLNFISSIYPEVENPSDLMYRNPVTLDRSRRYAEGGLARILKSQGFSPESIQYAQEKFEEERPYFGHSHTTNYESRPEMYLRRAPDKIVPYEDWEWGRSVGGTHNLLEGIKVPDRHPVYLLPEVLTHEGQHSLVASLDSNDIERRLPHQESILSKFARLFRSRRPGDMPSGITGQDTLEELAPQLVAAEGYLPAGQSLVHSKLGRQLFQTPEEKLWYLSRRYPTPLDLDAMTGAAPR